MTSADKIRFFFEQNVFDDSGMYMCLGDFYRYFSFQPRINLHIDNVSPNSKISALERY
jgi:hypothetical protein